MIKISEYLKSAMAIRYNFSWRSIPNVQLFSAQQNWPGIIVKKNSDIDYDVTTFNTPQQAMKIIMADLDNMHYGIFNEDVAEFTKRWYNTYDVKSLDSRAKKSLEQNIARRLKKHVEIYINRGAFNKFSHYDEKAIIAKKEKMNKQQLFNYLVVKSKYGEGDFINLYGNVDISGGSNIVKHNQWEIIFDDALKIDPKGVINLLDKVETTLKAKKMGKLAYGKVYIVDRLSGKALADYNWTTDVVRLGQRRKSEELRHFIHELGHRLHYKFLTKDQDKAIKETFYEVAKSKTSAAVGDELIEATTGNTYKVTDIKYTRSSKLYIVNLLILGENSPRKFKVGQSYQIPSGMVGSQLQVVGKGSPNDSYFPTAYGRTDHYEFFSELFAGYMENKIKPPAKDWLAGILGV